MASSQSYQWMYYSCYGLDSWERMSRNCKFLHENRTEGCTTAAMDWASECEHLNIIQFLHENRTEGCTTRAMDFAARNGHFEIVKFLHNNRTEGASPLAIEFASDYGYFDIFKFLHENRTEGFSFLPVNWDHLIWRSITSIICLYLITL